MTDGQEGFTLVEVLIGLVIGTVALLIATVVMSGALSTRAAVTNASSRIEDMVGASALQHRLVARAMKLQRGEEDPTLATLAGDASEVRFVGAFADGPHLEGLWEVEVDLQPDGGAGRFLVQGRPFSPRPNSESGSFIQLAAGRLDARARFSFGQVTREGVVWAAGWRSDEPGPDLVGLDPDGDGEAPMIVVRLLAAPEAAT